MIAAVVAVVSALVVRASPATAGVPANAAWFEGYIETPGEPTLHVDTTITNDGPQLRWQDLIDGARIFEKGYALV